MAEPKDWWDKAEIIAKFLIPIVVAGTAYLLNGQISERQSNTEKSKLAIDILSVPLDAEDVGKEDPLRRWALETLSVEFDFSETERKLILTGERSLPRVTLLDGSISLEGDRIDLSEFSLSLEEDARRALYDLESKPIDLQVPDP